MSTVRTQTPPRGVRTIETDRRAAERFAVNAGTTCPFAGPVAADVGPVKVLSVSMAGVGLRLGHRVEPGTLLVVELANPEKGFVKTVLVWVDSVSTDPVGCVVGGTFLTPLSYHEMSTLVL